MEKIDINKIRGQYREEGYYDGDPNKPFISGGDDTIESIKMVAEKVNELVEALFTMKGKEE